MAGEAWPCSGRECSRWPDWGRGNCAKTASLQRKAGWFPGLKARNRPKTITFAEEPQVDQQFSQKVITAAGFPELKARNRPKTTTFAEEPQVDQQFSLKVITAAGFPEPLGTQVAVDPSGSPFGASRKASCPRLPKGFSAQLEPMRVVHQSIQDRIRQGRIPDPLVPFLHR